MRETIADAPYPCDGWVVPAKSPARPKSSSSSSKAASPKSAKRTAKNHSCQPASRRLDEWPDGAWRGRLEEPTGATNLSCQPAARSADEWPDGPGEGAKRPEATKSAGARAGGASSLPLPAYRIGADENGLGPRLGPLIVTAVLAEVSDAGHKLVSRATRGRLAELLGDSKALLSHGDVALGEAWARCLVAREAGGDARHTSIEDIVRAISVDPHEVLQKPCPDRARPQCWATHGEAFEADDELVRSVEWALRTLEDKGVRVRMVRSVIVCTNALNDAAKRGRSRFHVDLHAMERLVLGMRDQVPSDVLSVCGKVGGIGHYQDAFGPLNGRLSTTLVEKRHESAYHFPGIGEIRFVVDADANDRLVGLASLVGKWLREVLMGRITRHYRAFDPELPDASGYHDPITDRFVAATRLHRKRDRIPDDCFERTSLGRVDSISTPAER